MKKVLYVSIFVIISILFVACSGNDNDQSQDLSIESTEQMDQKNSITFSDDAGIESDVEEIEHDDEAVKNADSNAAERKIIYTANLHIKVKDFQKSVQNIESEAAEKKGYIVDSNMYEGDREGMKTGTITVRIPQEHFRSFIQLIEKGSTKVMESSVSGQDVTEEYVDLDARLKSKRTVEKRLLAFLEEAKKTEDLLKISNDLADVQEDIEELLGRMNYLENRTDLATVTIYMEETSVTLSDSDDLNTWEQTKEQFLKSINWLLSAFSGLVVVFIGGLPIILLLLIIGMILFILIRKQVRKRNENDKL